MPCWRPGTVSVLTIRLRLEEVAAVEEEVDEDDECLLVVALYGMLVLGRVLLIVVAAVEDVVVVVVVVVVARQAKRKALSVLDFILGLASPSFPLVSGCYDPLNNAKQRLPRQRNQFLGFSFYCVLGLLSHRSAEKDWFWLMVSPLAEVDV